MSGFAGRWAEFAGPRSGGQPAARPGRSARAGAGRLAGVLAAALLVLAGPVASAWVGVSSAAATSTSAWTQLFPATSPPARYYAPMAYDPATSQLVLFGGNFGSGNFGDTWTWDGTTWSLLSSTGPSARQGAAMAYDPATSQLVLFGGAGISGVLRDTWTWNGTAWTQLSPTPSPPVRYVASMAYDPSTSQLVLFGGFGSTARLGDT